MKIGDKAESNDPILPFENDSQVVGKCRCVYEDEIFEGNNKVCWTKDFLLRKWNWSACKYEIRTVDNMDYLIIEWKSGDYRFGGFDTNYYVFTKA